jgi:hypothetical protein
MPRSATGWGRQRLSVKLRPRLEGRHRAQDHIKARFILRRCPALRPGTIGAYLLAFVSVGVATAVRLAIGPYVDGLQFATYLLAVIITTLISGSVPAFFLWCSVVLRLHFLCFRPAFLCTLKSRVMCWLSSSIRA